MAKPIYHPQRGEIYFIEIDDHEVVGSEFKGPHFHLVVSNNALRTNPQELGVVVPLTSPESKTGQPKDLGDYRKFRIRILESAKIREPGERLCAGDSLALTEQVRVMSVERFKQKPVAKVTQAALGAVESGLAFVLDIPLPVLELPKPAESSESSAP